MGVRRCGGSGAQVFGPLPSRIVTHANPLTSLGRAEFPAAPSRHLKVLGLTPHREKRDYSVNDNAEQGLSSALGEVALFLGGRSKGLFGFDLARLQKSSYCL